MARNDKRERLAGPAADTGLPEEFTGVGDSGEFPVWQAKQPNSSGTKFKLINESADRTFAVVLDKGDEVITTLRRFASERHLPASQFTGIGAFSDVVLGFFDREKKEYKKIPIREQVEVLSLTGDITFQEDRLNVHAHVVIGKSDGTAHGGHLIEAHVFPTLELMLVESPKYLQRRKDPETGLALIDLDAA